MPSWSDWTPALRRLGFALAPGQLPLGALTGWVQPGSTLLGSVHGKQVELRFPGRLVVARVPIDPALDLGLSVEPEGVFPTPKIHTTNPDFNTLFAAQADEYDRAASLLASQILEALVTLLGPSIELSLRDDAISLTGDGATWLRTCLPRAVEIVHRIDDRRSSVPVPEVLRKHRAPLGRFAIEHQLRIDDTPLRLSGHTRGVKVQVVFARAAPSRITLQASLHLDRSLDLDLRVEPATLITPLRALLPGQTDRRVGDAAFDAAFHVRTSRPDIVGRAFSGSTCRALMRCAAGASSLLLDDAGLRWQAEIDDDAAPAEALGLALGALDEIARAVLSAPSPEPRGPFR